MVVSQDSCASNIAIKFVQGHDICIEAVPDPFGTVSDTACIQPVSEYFLVTRYRHFEWARLVDVTVYCTVLFFSSLLIADQFSTNILRPELTLTFIPFFFLFKQPKKKLRRCFFLSSSFFPLFRGNKRNTRIFCSETDEHQF